MQGPSSHRKVNPLYFASFDEFLHWRTADDILRTGHLFSENSMLPVGPYYPGLEIVTNALSTTSGLSTFSGRHSRNKRAALINDPVAFLTL